MIDNKPPSLEELKKTILCLPQRRLIGDRVISIVTDTLDKIIPAGIIEYGFESFGRIYLKDAKPTLEMSILLTKNLMLIDITFDKEKQTATSLFLTKSAIIQLKTFSSPESSEDEENLPYRAELVIGGGAFSGFNYSAEGDRKIVNALITYGYKCISASQKLTGEGL